MADTTITFYNEETKQKIPVRAVDNGDGTFSLRVESGLVVGDVSIGAVEIKNADSDARARVGSIGDWDESVVSLAAHDPSLGKGSDAAETNPASTAPLISLIKGLLTILGDVWDDANNFLRVQLGAGTSFVGTVGGNTVDVAAELTRPGDTTAYTANDVVSDNTSATTPLEFENFARVNGGGGYIVGAKLSTDKKSITPRMRVHLFRAADATLAADNAPYKELYDDADKRLGYFDLPAMTTAVNTTDSTVSRSQDIGLRIPFTTGANRSIFAVLEALDAFVPANGQKFYLELLGEPS